MIVCDIGSGLSKCIFGKDRWITPSLVSNMTDKKVDIESFLKTPLDHEVITLDKQKYFVGSNAFSNGIDIVNSANENWATEKANLILHLSAIAKSHPDGYNGVVYLVTGLPIGQYKNKQKRVAQKEMLIGQHVFSSLNKKYNIEIREDTLQIFPQAMGLHFSISVNNDISVDCANSINGYLDVGTFTTGACKVSFNTLDNKESDGIEIGMHHLSEKLFEYVKKTYGVSHSQAEFNLFMRKGIIPVPQNGEIIQVDLVEIAEPFVEEVFEPVFAWIEKHWSLSSMYLFLSGGGAKYLYSVLKKKAKHASLLHPLDSKVKPKNNVPRDLLPLFDVVEGYLFLAQVQKFGKVA